MYRRVLPLLLTAVLLLSGCASGQKNMPQKTDEKEMTDQPSDMSGEGSMYMHRPYVIIDEVHFNAVLFQLTGRNQSIHRVSGKTGNLAGHD